MGQDLSQTPLSLYLHIPFCLTRCGYCSFFSLPYRQQDMKRYLEILQQELELYHSILQHPLKSVYFGGGSPSLLSPEDINRILHPLHLHPDAELSLEINPIQITPAYLKALQSTPINRLSIGLQSMTDSELKWLNRKHLASSIPDRIALCREHGYANISLDFIYGLPLELYKSASDALDSLKFNLDAYLLLQPDHISCYLLSLDEDSQLGQALQQGCISLPGDELAAREYHLIRRSLISAGFQHYEISNFALPGHESRHNLCYWLGDNYLACGASGAGWIKPRRYQNPADLQAYSRNVLAEIMFPGAEFCTADQIRRDKLMMGLRLTKGIDLSDPDYAYSDSEQAEFRDRVERLKSMGMLKQRGHRLALSTKALFVSNSVIGELIY